MEFTIYSIGDSAYLAQVLNALAMICGTGSFKTLVAIGGVIGLLVMGVQCIMTGTRQFNIHQTLVGMMAYMIMFGPSCTVLIEDAYNGTVRPVANVPIGPAVAGSMISNIGYGITDLFEQAYNDDITLTRKNTVEAMKALGELRSIAADNSIIEAASASLGSDVNLQLSIDNYFRECTMTGITLGTTTASQIYNQGIDGLRFDSNVYGTQVWLPSHVGEFMTCTAAWQPLKTAIDTAFRDPRTIRSVNRLLGIQTANGAVSDNFDELDNVYDMLTGAGQSASNYVKTAVLERLYEQAAAGTYRDLNDLASAVMVSTAIEQRNTQWAAEQSMFLTTMRPLMAFFEAFLYAITPLMAMLMMMGAFGMQLIGKYFQLTVWLQLWFPVLSVTNLYITMGARSELSNFLTDPVTFYGINQANQALQTWVSTGGMLAAATPLISLFILTGSTYAFTTLTGRMSGGDHINEKIATPDTIQPGAALAMMATKTFNGARGAITTGAETMMPKMNVAQNITAAMNRSLSQMQSDTNAVSQTLVNDITSGRNSTLSASITESVGESVAANHTEFAQSVINAARSMGFDVKAGTQQGNQLVGAVAVSMAADGRLGVSGGVDPGSYLQKAIGWLEKQVGNTAGGGATSQGSTTGADASSGGSAGVINPPVSGGNTINTPTVGFADNSEKKEGATAKKGIGAAIPGFQANGGVGVDATNSSSVRDTSGTSTETSTSRGISSSFNLSKSDMASIVETTNKSLQKTASETVAKTSGSSESSSLQKAVSHLASSAKAYQEITTASDSVGVNQSYDFVQFAHALNTDKDALMYQYNLEEATKHFSPKQREELNKLTDEYRYMYGVSDPKDARMAATLQYLQTNGGNEGRAMLGEIIAKKMGMNAVSTEAPSNKGIDAVVPMSDSLRNADMKKPTDNYSQENFDRITQDVEKGEHKVFSANEDNLNKVSDVANEQERIRKKNDQEIALHSLMAGVPNKEYAASKMNMLCGEGYQNLDQSESAMEKMGFTRAQSSSYSEIRIRGEIGPEHHRALLEDTRVLLGKPALKDEAGNTVYDDDTKAVTAAIERDFVQASKERNVSMLSNVLAFSKLSQDLSGNVFGSGRHNMSPSGENLSLKIPRKPSERPNYEAGVKQGIPIDEDHPGYEEGNLRKLAETIGQNMD